MTAVESRIKTDVVIVGTGAAGVMAALAAAREGAMQTQNGGDGR